MFSEKFHASHMMDTDGKYESTNPSASLPKSALPANAPHQFFTSPWRDYLNAKQLQSADAEVSAAFSVDKPADEAKGMRGNNSSSLPGFLILFCFLINELRLQI